MSEKQLGTPTFTVGVDYEPRPYAMRTQEFYARQVAFEYFKTATNSLRTAAEFDVFDYLPKKVSIAHHGTNGNGNDFFLMETDDLIAYISHQVGYQVEIVVASASIDTSRNFAKSFVDSLPETEVKDDQVEMSVTYLSPDGVVEKSRSIDVTPWQDIKRNYPGKAGDGLVEMMALERPSHSGKLILWHGPPGTGKTTALRALAHAWKSWCHTTYVSDPERMFNEPYYLIETASGKRSDGKWRLMIAEDTDEFLRATAKNTSPAALGRLLNFTDGILGQGSDTLLLLTTNEPLDKLAPALTRPGRCLAEMHFDKFTTAQAREWLPEGFKAPDQAATLAELIELQNNTKVTAEKKFDDPVGQYL